MTHAPEPTRATIEDTIAALLTRRLDGDVELVTTNNRVRLVSYRKHRAHVEVRISRRLMALGEQVVEPIVGFVCDAPEARQQLRGLYAQIPASTSRPRSRPAMVPRGLCHDLEVLLRRESLSAFGEPTSGVDITWGVARRLRRPQRSIRLGTYHFERHFIRIHPRLDHPEVPEWFVGFVIFHELLHHRLGTETRGGRRVLHSPAFREAEARHPRYRDAQAWERHELPKLLRGRGKWRAVR